MAKRLLIQSPLLTSMTLAEVADNATLDDVRRAALATIPEAQRTKDLEVTFERNDDDDIDGDGDDEERDGKSDVIDGLRVHVGRCKKVEVTVRYFGKSKTRKFVPSARIKRVKNWATKVFEVPAAEAARHSLRLPDTTEELAADVHVGTLVLKGTCGVVLDLVPSDRINGAA